MATNREYVQLIDKLTELTQSGKIEWNRRSCPEKLLGTDNKIDFIYETEYKSRKLRLYEESYKQFTDEFEFHWASGVILEFIDDDGGHIWNFPELRSIWDLLRAVKYKEAGVDSFIQDVLGDL